MISEQRVEVALKFLHEKAQEAAQARATVRYLEGYMKTKLAQLKASSRATSNAAAEDDARANPDFIELLDGYRVAVEKDAEFMFKREAASALIDAWRTQQSNARAEGRIG